MTIAAISLVQGVLLPNAVAAQYTCPPNSKVVIRNVSFANTDGTNPHTVTAHIVPSGGSPGAATQVIPSQSIAASKTYVSPELDGKVLNAGDTLQCFADAAGDVSINANGIQQT